MTDGIIQKECKKMIDLHTPSEHKSCFIRLQTELIERIKAEFDFEASKYFDVTIKINYHQMTKKLVKELIGEDCACDVSGPCLAHKSDNK